MILYRFHSSQRFWNPLVIVPPVGCESLAKRLLALEQLCAACTPVEGMNRGGGGWAAELQTDWRHQQNRGHAWSTTQNKPGQTTTTQLLGLLGKRLTRGEAKTLPESGAHARTRTRYILSVYPGVFSFTSVSLTWMSRNDSVCVCENDRGQAEDLTLSCATLLHRRQLLRKAQLPLRLMPISCSSIIICLTYTGLHTLSIYTTYQWAGDRRRICIT